MARAADDYDGIKRRMRELRQEEGLQDTDPVTATGRDLDAIGAVYGLSREVGEADPSFRAKILIKITSRTRIGGIVLGLAEVA